MSKVVWVFRGLSVTPANQKLFFLMRRVYSTTRQEGERKLFRYSLISKVVCLLLQKRMTSVSRAVVAQQGQQLLKSNKSTNNVKRSANEKKEESAVIKFKNRIPSRPTPRSGQIVTSQILKRQSPLEELC